MTASQRQSCILLPCRSGQTWAVPPNCLAEIAALPLVAATGRARWRGLEIPLLPASSPIFAGSWPDTCPCAIFMGLGNQAASYWALPLADSGIRAVALVQTEMEEATEQLQPGCLAAFRWAGCLCQVPDLPALQARATGLS